MDSIFFLWLLQLFYFCHGEMWYEVALDVKQGKGEEWSP